MFLVNTSFYFCLGRWCQWGVVGGGGQLFVRLDMVLLGLKVKPVKDLWLNDTMCTLVNVLREDGRRINFKFLYTL